MRSFRHDTVFCAGLALLPLVALIAPRALCFAPGVLALVLSFLHYREYRVVPVPPRTGLMAVVGFLLLALASALWSADAGDAISRTGRAAGVLLPGLFLTGVAAMPAGVAAVSLVPRLYAAALGFLAVELNSDMVFYRFLHDQWTGRVHTDIANRSVVALILMLPPVLLMLYKAPHDRARTVTALFILIAAAAVYAGTNSQSAQLAIPVMGVAAALFFTRRRWLWIALSAFIAAFILIAPWLAVWLFKTIPPLMPESSFLKNGYALPRLEIWDFVARRVMESPVYGFGIEAARGMTFDTQQLYHNNNTVLHPHNIFLQLWLEFGVIGAAAGSVFIAALLNGISKLSRAMDRRTASAVLIGALSVGAMTYGLWQAWFLGALLAVSALLVLAVRIPSGTETRTGPSPS